MLNVLVPGGATATGMVPEHTPPEVRERSLDPGAMGPPIVWPASAHAHALTWMTPFIDGWMSQW